MIFNKAHLQWLFDLEKYKQTKIVPKLKEKNLHPTAFEKMNVGLATQVFSESVANGMRYYRQQHEKDGKMTQFVKGKHCFSYYYQQSVTKFNRAIFIDIESESTEKFIRLLNSAFDVMNGRCWKDAIHPGTWKKQRKVGKNFCMSHANIFRI